VRISSQDEIEKEANRYITSRK
jgi:hypothetical protein